MVSSTVGSNLHILEGNLEQCQWLTLFGVETMFDPPVQTLEISLQIWDRHRSESMINLIFFPEYELLHLA